MNLQDASVIIHLDLPWTPARMEQRLGRVARLGSSHEVVFSYAIRPPLCTREIVRTERILREKMAVAGVVSSEFPYLSMYDVSTNGPNKSDPSIVEAIRTTMSGWNASSSAETRSGVVVSVVAGPVDGFLAACRHDGQTRLVASSDGYVSEEPEAVSAFAQHSQGIGLSADVDECRRTLEALDDYLSLESALSGAAGGRSRASASRITLERISRIEQRARRHERAKIAALAAKARDAVGGYKGVDSERRLRDLSNTPMDDGAWLCEVASRSHVALQGTTTTQHASGIVALIILRQRHDMNALSHATKR